MHLPEWEATVAPPGLVHYGGPVDPQVAIGLARSRAGMETGVTGLSIVDLGSSPGEERPRVMIYSGYAGWGGGQLEAEIEEGSWYVVPAAPDDPFDDPETLWHAVLRRQGGLLSVVSTYPPDPALN